MTLGISRTAASESPSLGMPSLLAASLVGLCSADQVCELGAGRGAISHELARRFGCAVTLVDREPAPLELFDDLPHAAFRLVTDDVQNFLAVAAGKREKFKLVTAEGGIVGLAGVVETLESVRAVILDSGALAISTLVWHSNLEFNADLVGYQRSIPGSVREFYEGQAFLDKRRIVVTEDELRSRIDEAGFEIEASFNSDFGAWSRYFHHMHESWPSALGVAEGSSTVLDFQRSTSLDWAFFFLQGCQYLNYWNVVARPRV